MKIYFVNSVFPKMKKKFTFDFLHSTLIVYQVFIMTQNMTVLCLGDGKTSFIRRLQKKTSCTFITSPSSEVGTCFVFFSYMSKESLFQAEGMIKNLRSTNPSIHIYLIGTRSDLAVNGVPSTGVNGYSIETIRQKYHLPFYAISSVTGRGIERFVNLLM